MWVISSLEIYFVITSSNYAVKFKQDNMLLLNQCLTPRAAATWVYTYYPGGYMDFIQEYIWIYTQCISMNLSLSFHFYAPSHITQTQVYKSWFVSVLNSMGNIYSILGWHQQILVSYFNHYHLFPVLWIISGFALTWNFLHYKSKPCNCLPAWFGIFFQVTHPPCLWEMSCIQI